ncbi:hypothetical protein [Streptomyces sp. NPDC055134]
MQHRDHDLGDHSQGTDRTGEAGAGDGGGQGRCDDEQRTQVDIRRGVDVHNGDHHDKTERNNHQSAARWPLQEAILPPPAQRMMAARADATVAETGGSHTVNVSKPAEVAAFIKAAATGATA